MNNDIRKLIDDKWDEIKELIAQKVIDEIGEDRLIKYWFGVTE